MLWSYWCLFIFTSVIPFVLLRLYLRGFICKADVFICFYLYFEGDIPEIDIVATTDLVNRLSITSPLCGTSQIMQLFSALNVIAPDQCLDTAFILSVQVTFFQRWNTCLFPSLPISATVVSVQPWDRHVWWHREFADYLLQCVGPAEYLKL